MSEVRRVMAIDPGDAHVGMALFHDGVCGWVDELEPWSCLLLLRDNLLDQQLDVIVIESFQLYADKAMQQTGSSMPTAELIGGIKATVAWFGPEVQIEMQPATIKRPTLRIMKGRKYKRRALVEKAGGHASDAELHGYYYTQNNKS